jgi:hypothetical protein
MIMREAPRANPELEALIEKARNHVMSPAEILAQKRSWVIGQMGLSRPDMSREEIEELVDRSLGPAPSTATDLEAAEAAFRAHYEGSWACWHSLSDLGKAAWVRAARAARGA